MSVTARLALRFLAAIMVAVFVGACAVHPGTESRKLASEVTAACRESDLYVGQGVGGCIGFYVLDGFVTGGFVLPSRLNLDDTVARRLSPEQRDLIGRTEAWPICRVTRIGDDDYSVMAFGGQHLSLGMFRLIVTELDGSALFYRMSPNDDQSQVAYSGTAINVDAMATKLETSRAQGRDE